MNLFEIIGPVMTGPSSSHTAGAVRIGNAALNLFGKKPEEAVIKLYNSFSKTGKGHGTDKALIAGLLGFAPDDVRIINASREAENAGLKISVEFMGNNPDYHANTAEIILYHGSEKMVVLGKSIGGGRIVITQVDGYETKYTGEYHGLMTIHDDVPGVVSVVTGCLAQMGVNIAFMRMYRKRKGSKVMMIIDTDNPIPPAVKDILSNNRHIYKTVILPRNEDEE
ncbi:MAG TPA: L-serine ammonia-lyase, iron-sulfur-dependent, subunit beta [Clostridiales bacterium]|nr:L-serine ammonia-lyase, iron-sulfur-dependent, subunit beta [Clostridiales bacterium]